MEKITTTLREYFNNKEICEPKDPVENIIFLGYNNDVFSIRFHLIGCHFRNCEFRLFSAFDYNLDFVRCTFENCVFYEDSIFASFAYCVFINNSFPNGFRHAFNPATSFLHCDYDDSFLESLSKEMVCPVSGEFVGWKKACLLYRGNLAYLIVREVIVKLLVPEDSKRSSALSNKCRCEKAKVLEIQDTDGVKIDISEDYIVASMYELKFRASNLSLVSPKNKIRTQYTPGEMVYPSTFDPDPIVECGGGIHFFMTREEALGYRF